MALRERLYFPVACWVTQVAQSFWSDKNYWEEHVHLVFKLLKTFCFQQKLLDSSYLLGFLQIDIFFISWTIVSLGNMFFFVFMFSDYCKNPTPKRVGHHLEIENYF